ncbi:MAG TPA: acyltransferase [Acidobacteriaceae bacterium]|nr:acyltransferase [Acidobacteriaceae bacterium]
MQSKPVSRIPSLDGLRALSILMVMLLHSLQKLSQTHHVAKAWYVAGNGGLGVFIFFVISGYLITTLLLREFDRSGRISLRRFYFRRALRILPPVYVYIAVIVMLALAGKFVLTRLNIVSAMFFFANDVRRPWAMDHLWSLAIEEQFYLLWPSVLLLCLRRGGRATAARFALLVIVCCPFLRIAGYEFFGRGHRMLIESSLFSRADSLMFGSFVALGAGTPKFERLFARANRVWWLFPIVLFLVSSPLEALYGTHWTNPVGSSLNGVCVGFLLLWVIRNHTSWVGRCLNWGPVVKIGVLSYSLYIWQQLFLNSSSPEVFGHSILDQVPVCFVFLAGAAAFSYYLIETPSLRWRSRIEARFAAPVKSGTVTVLE